MSGKDSESYETPSGLLGRFEIWLKPVSLNSLIRMREWHRNQLLGNWRREIANHSLLGEFAISPQGPWPILIRITQLVGKRGRAFDDDNRSGMAKLINDGLKRLELIPDDSPKYVRTAYGDAEPFSQHPEKPFGGVRVEILAAQEADDWMEVAAIRILGSLGIDTAGNEALIKSTANMIREQALAIDHGALAKISKFAKAVI